MGLGFEYRLHQRLGLNSEKVTLLELAEDVGDQLLLGVVANGVRGGLRLQLWRQALDEARASRDPLQATFLNVLGDDRPPASADIASWKTSKIFSTTSICTSVAPYRCRTSTE